MPTLEFKGKPFVYSHHLSVPFRELIIEPKKSLPLKGKTPSLDDNLIIHGDNLEALKALLPRYAGKVDIVYIDPPYNTGNEGWIYNDNVKAPQLSDWLGKIVDTDDMERHDKWLTMMWPRLTLIRELMSASGIIFVSINSIESANLRLILDEIFGPENFVEDIVWKNKYGPGASTTGFGSVNETIYCYSKQAISALFAPLDEAAQQAYSKRDAKYAQRGGYLTQPLMTRSKDDRPNLVYPIEHKGEIITPRKQWIWSQARLLSAIDKDEVVFKKGADGWSVRFKQYLKNEDGTLRRGKPISLWNGPFNQEGTWEIEAIFGDKDAFNNPKPSSLITKILNISVDEDEGKCALVLDSFAGSGTTAQAVLALNNVDGGSRKFILIETEEYADSLTAERVRRIIKGVPESNDEVLKKGLGGSFTYCELGEPMDMERFFSEDGNAPNYDQVARYIAYTATGEALDAKEGNDGFAGYAGKYRLHLLYKSDPKWMRSNEAMLDLTTAERISEAAAKDGNKQVLVFAAGKLMSQRALTELGIIFCQLPYSVYRILGNGTEGVAGADEA